MSCIVVAEDHFLCSRVLDALDHGSVVHGIRQNHTVGQLLGQSAQSGIIGDVAGREDQGGWLVVQRGELLLQRQVHGAVAGNVAGASSAGAVLAQGGLHGLDDDGVLGHAEVVVRAPDSDLVFGLGGVCTRELLSQAVDVVEKAIGLVLALLLQLALIDAFVVEGLAGGRCGVRDGSNGLEWAGCMMSSGKIKKTGFRCEYSGIQPKDTKSELAEQTQKGNRFFLHTYRHREQGWPCAAHAGQKP